MHQPNLTASLCCCLCLFLLALPLAGDLNTDVELDLKVASPPCGLGGRDPIEFFVAARHMDGVRQVKFLFSWQPANAVASVRGRADGEAEEKAFVTPGPALVEGNQAEFGMATFGPGLDGEGTLARFVFELAEQIDADTPVDIRIEQLRLGPSSTQHDTVRPVQALVLGNYCDETGRTVGRGLFIRPATAHLYFSPRSSAQVADGSSGEVLLSARLLEEGIFLPGQSMTWHIANQGSVPVYALASGEALVVEPGGVREGSARSDARGDAYLRLDAEPGPAPGPGTVSLTVCAERAAAQHCASARVTWEPRNTAVAASGAPTPATPLELGPNYPNPFNASTTLPIFVPQQHPGDLRLEILDLAGQVVDVLLAGPLPPGRHRLLWNGYDHRGRPLASGLYFCRLRSGTQEQIRSLVLLR